LCICILLSEPCRYVIAASTHHIPFASRERSFHPASLPQLIKVCNSESSRGYVCVRVGPRDYGTAAADVWSRSAILVERLVFAGCKADDSIEKRKEEKESSKRPPPSHEGLDWGKSIPSYLQSTVESELCDDWTVAIKEAEAISAARRKAIEQGLDPEVAEDQSRAAVRLSRSVSIWNRIREEAARDIEGEPMLSSFMYTSILSHESFGEALAFILSNRIADETLLPTQLFSLFMTLERDHPEVLKGALADLQAVYDRVWFLNPRVLRLSFNDFASPWRSTTLGSLSSLIFDRSCILLCCPQSRGGPVRCALLDGWRKRERCTRLPYRDRLLESLCRIQHA
jgi:hypothetical protein